MSRPAWEPTAFGDRNRLWTTGLWPEPAGPPHSVRDVIAVAEMVRSIAEQMATSTEPTNRAAVEHAIRSVNYRLGQRGRGLAVNWVKSPRAAMEVMVDRCDYHRGMTVRHLGVCRFCRSSWDAERVVAREVYSQHAFVMNSHMSEGLARVGPTVSRLGNSVETVLASELGSEEPGLFSIFDSRITSQFATNTHTQSLILRHFGTDWGHDAVEFSQAAGIWWSGINRHIVCDRPDVIKHDAQARIHCADGPAIKYSDGWSAYAWNGVRVPKDMILSNWSVSRIYREPNVEVRRCAVEKMGWGRFITEANLQPVGESVPDPGNPGHMLSLYHVPDSIANAKVLLCDNATPERDGTRRRFGLLVPSAVMHPLTAAAWTFGLTDQQYAQMTHAY